MNSQTMPISSVMAVFSYVTGFFKIVSVIVYIKISRAKKYNERRIKYQFV